MNNLNQKLNIFFFFFTIAVKTEMDLCVCDHSSIASSHIHTQLQSTLLPSINLLLISVHNTVKIYRIISRGTLLTSTGSKAMLWLSDQVCAVSSKRGGAECNCTSHYQYFLTLNHTLLEKSEVGCKNKDFVHYDFLTQ